MAAKGNTRRGFTLIELLVVVSIIALLVSILMPALGRARDQAKTTVCSTNQRALMNSWVVYAADNEGWLVGADCSANMGQPWDWMGSPGAISDYVSHGAEAWYEPSERDPALLAKEREEAIMAGNLWDYVGALDTYLCPSHKVADTPEIRSLHYNCPRDERKLSYVFVSTLNGNIAYQYEIYKKLNQIQRPSEKIGMTEQHDPRGVNMGGWVFQYATQEDVNSGVAAFIGEPLVTWHNGGQLFAFADAHVEHRKWVEPETLAVIATGLLYQFAGTADENEDWRWIWERLPRRYRDSR